MIQPDEAGRREEFMTVEKRVVELEKEVETLKQALTSLSKQIHFVESNQQSSIEDIKARLDIMSLPAL